MKQSLSLSSRKVLLGLLFSLCACNLQAQQRPFYDIASHADTYTPVSTEAASLFKRLPDGIDYARGRATLRIPLFEIKTPSFTLPIALSYTTSGIKVNQANGAVALGWVFEAEPMITREVRGLRDEQSYLRSKDLYADDPEYYLTQVGNGSHDLLPDFFHYRTLASSGKFYLEMANNLEFKPRLLSPDYVKLETPGNAVSGDFFDNEITLTDPAGNVYRYGTDANSREYTYFNDSRLTTTTTWKVSSITSLNGEQITFSYRGNNTKREKIYSSYDYYAMEEKTSQMENTGPDNLVPPLPGYWQGVNGTENYYYLSYDSPKPYLKKWLPGSDKPYCPTYMEVNTHYLSRITFPGGEVTLTYNQVGNLQGMEVRSSEGKLIRQIRFETRSVGYDRYLLTRVVMNDGQGTPRQVYEMDYYNEDLSINPMSKAVDYLGYYNGHTENTDLIPKRTIELKESADVPDGSGTKVEIGGASNREGWYEHSRTYSLKTIHYPTGGRSVYDYRMHITPDHHLGGVLLSSITDYPAPLSSAGRIERRFVYGGRSNPSAYGFLRYPMYDWAFEDKMQKKYFMGGITNSTYTHNYYLYSESNKLCPDNEIYYDRVTEYVNGRKTVHDFSTGNEYATNSIYKDPEFSETFENNFWEPYWNGEYLTAGQQSDYYTGNTLTQRTASGCDPMQSTLQEIKRNTLVVDFSGGSPQSGVQRAWRESFTLRNLLLMGIRSQYPEERRTHYTPQGELEESQTPYYEDESGQADPYGLMRKQVNRTIDGKTYTIRYKYPADFTEEVYRKMIQKGAVGLPVEEHRYLGDDLKKIVRYRYALNTAVQSGFALEEIEETTDETCSTFRTVEAYSDYLPAGVPLQVTRADGTTQCFLWSCQSTQAVAVIDNATAAEVRGALGISPEALADYEQLGESQYALLEQLQKALPKAHVTVYRHQPLCGIKQITGPDGRKAHNEYDNYGRLIRQKDTDGETLREYEYNETNKD